MPIVFPYTNIDSVEMFIETIKKDIQHWYLPTNCVPWFRGQADSSLPPKPGIFRRGIKEHDLSLTFRKRAPSLGKTPQRDAWDEWLFLMQHVGVPTRLLDWTEGALIGLYFAVCQKPKTDPGVWMLHPLELNQLAFGEKVFPATTDKEFMRRCMLAFQDVPQAGKLPIAVLPRHIHIRISMQKGCFTLHGLDYRSFEAIYKGTSLVQEGFFKKYVIESNQVNRILEDLKMLGITHSNLFPDLDGLAYELKMSF